MFFKNFKNIYKKRIKKLKNRYEQRLKSQNKNFINILRHDIKTPILAQISVLETYLKNESVFNDIIREVLNSNYFLKEIVNNTLFLLEFESDKPDLHLENVDIMSEINKICDSIKYFADEKNQNIIIKTNKKKGINILADKKLIRKIIYNLLAESISYGFENSDIEINLKEYKNSFSFRTRNKSIYMTKEKLNTLLEDSKNDGDLNKLGMRLNLNVAKKLIDAHHWKIFAESEKGNISEFGFTVKKS